MHLSLLFLFFFVVLVLPEVLHLAFGAVVKSALALLGIACATLALLIGCAALALLYQTLAAVFGLHAVALVARPLVALTVIVGPVALWVYTSTPHAPTAAPAPTAPQPLIWRAH